MTLKQFIKKFKAENGFSNTLIGLMSFIAVCFLVTCPSNYVYAPWSVWEGIAFGVGACVFAPVGINLIQYYWLKEEPNNWEIVYTMTGIITGVPSGIAVMYYNPSWLTTGLILLAIFLLWAYVWKLRFIWFKKS